MQTNTEETKKKVVKLHIKDGHTISSLAAKYGICHATVLNWIRAYREECQTNIWHNQVQPHSYNGCQALYEARHGLA